VRSSPSPGFYFWLKLRKSSADRSYTGRERRFLRDPFDLRKNTRRLDAANRWLVAVKRQVQTGEPPSGIGKAVEKVEELLSYGGRDPTGW
jgi:hypothetical protein